jgi:hypothetical protein
VNRQGVFRNEKEEIHAGAKVPTRYRLVDVVDRIAHSAEQATLPVRRQPLFIQRGFRRFDQAFCDTHCAMKRQQADFHFTQAVEVGSEAVFPAGLKK